jgi:hypothetical protein
VRSALTIWVQCTIHQQHPASRTRGNRRRSLWLGSDLAALEAALILPANFDKLFGRILTKGEGSNGVALTVGSVFQQSTDLISFVYSITTLATTTWVSALHFPETDTGTGTDRSVFMDVGAASPLYRSITGTTRPDTGKTAGNSQPWAVGTVFKYINDAVPLTLFAVSDKPIETTGATGIWLW